MATPSALFSKIEALAEKVAGHKGLRLYDLEISGSGRGRILRVFIDRTDKETVSLEDCSEFSKAFSLLLDVEDPIDGTYNLEVSSPGIERALKKSWHYAESVGEEVQVNLRKPLADLHEQVAGKHANRKKFKGVLKALDGDQASFEFEGLEIAVPVEVISKAKVVFDFNKKD